MIKCLCRPEVYNKKLFYKQVMGACILGIHRDLFDSIKAGGIK